jgi:hydrogenase maturation protease
MTKVLVAGVGNIFLGDDGFGVEVARRLATKTLPAHVQVQDFGIRGVHLAYQLLEGYDLLILVDALPFGATPGTLCVMEPVMEPKINGAGQDDALSDAHTMNPRSVLSMVAALGGRIDRVLVVGCEPQEIVDRIGLSEPASRAVDEAVQLVNDLLMREIATGVEIE